MRILESAPAARKALLTSVPAWRNLGICGLQGEGFFKEAADGLRDRIGIIDDQLALPINVAPSWLKR
jgi:hypothetical protein